ncbi:MAG: radical SAM protein [Nitrospirota bacterium]
MRSAPDYIQLYPTMRCNMDCGFCFNRHLPPVKDMAFADFKAMVEKLKLLGVRTIDIMGGEPTLHEDLLSLIRYSLQEGMNLNLSSNGTDRLQLAAIAAIMEKHPRVKVGVSINDRKTAQGLEEFIRRHRPTVKMVAGRRIDATLVKYILSMGPESFYLLYRDAVTPDQLAETAPFDEFWSYVRTAYEPGTVGVVSCSGFLPDLARYPELLKARCPAGTTKLGIMPDGSVYPCNLFFGQQEFLLGNIFTTPFEEIWGSPSLTFFRTFAGNTCPRTTCVLHTKCHGGCPAHSCALAGKRSAPEPRCMTD